MQKHFISLILIIILMLPIVSINTYAAEASFHDIPTKSWYYSPIRSAYEQGIMMGTSSEFFEPDGTLTRGMFVTVLGRIAGVDITVYDDGSNYLDVSEGQYYTPYVKWAGMNGITNGISSDYFGTENPITRQQMAVFIARYLDSTGQTLPVSDTAPDFYNDEGNVAEYAKEGVESIRPSGLFLGDENHNLNPDGTATRAEAAAVFVRLNRALRGGDTPAINTWTDYVAPSKIICIDAGHQLQGNSSKEPVGPGSTVYKAKVSSGTEGIATHVAEYVLTLNVSLQLKEELDARGYTVVMTRQTHNVDLSNIERAEIANACHADAFLRIHANGSSNSSVNGTLCICQTANNPWNKALARQSYALSASVVNNICALTGSKNQGVMQSDSYTGINWAQVPVTILEMGYMSNAAEDLKMQNAYYQKLIVLGIANGLDEYFSKT